MRLGWIPDWPVYVYGVALVGGRLLAVGVPAVDQKLLLQRGPLGGRACSRSGRACSCKCLVLTRLVLS